MNDAYGALIIPGLLAIMILSLFVQFIKSRNIKEAKLSPYILVFNMFFFIIIVMLFIFLSMVIIVKYII